MYVQLRSYRTIQQLFTSKVVLLRLTIEIQLQCPVPTLLGGALQIWAFFWGRGIIPKKEDIIYHSIDKRFPKFGKKNLGLENIFTLLYTTSDYYGITMVLVLGPIIIGKF